MNACRYNICYQLHDDLRSELLLAGVKMQQTKFDDYNSAKQALDSLMQASQAFKNHLEEDKIIFGTVAPFVPFVISQLDRTNKRNTQLLSQIIEQVHKYETLRTSSGRCSVWSEIRMLFFEFLASVLNNMSREEIVINDLLWDNLSNEHLSQLANNAKKAY